MPPRKVYNLACICMDQAFNLVCMNVLTMQRCLFNCFSHLHTHTAASMLDEGKKEFYDPRKVS